MPRHGMDGYIHMQSGRIISVADEAARNWHGLFRRPGYGHADQVRAGDQAIRRIILNPTCTGKIDAAPGMGTATSANRT